MVLLNKTTIPQSTIINRSEGVNVHETRVEKLYLLHVLVYKPWDL